MTTFFDTMEALADACSAEYPLWVVVKFWENVARSDSNSCWEWTGPRRDCQGYGKVYFQGKNTAYAHRVAWMIINGPIKDKLCVLHKCDNPPCCNPSHLFLGTIQENNADRDRKGRCRAAAPPGAANGNAKLTQADVIEIRRQYHDDGANQGQLADVFAVSRIKISSIIRRRTWKHV